MQKEIRAYLDRIGFEGEPSNDYKTLSRLQECHLLTVPYENLDIMRSIPLSLEPRDIYEKIVIRGRGGYCFELNGLFTWLLRELKFDVTEYMARFLRDETEIPMRRHRVLRVVCDDGVYLCDVGVGGVIPRLPVKMELGVVNVQGAEQYKLEKEDFLGTVLYEYKHGEWRKLYSFTAEEQLNIDYVMPSFYCENHPESYFRTLDMVHIFTEEGRKVVADRELKIFGKSGVEIIVPESEEKYKELLEEHFGLKI